MNVCGASEKSFGASCQIDAEIDHDFHEWETHSEGASLRWPNFKHEDHVTVTCWSMDCIEGECEHIDEDGEPFDLSKCPSIEMVACPDCMVERGYGRDAEWWEGPIAPWPHRDPAPVPVIPAPDAHAAIFRANPDREVSS